MRGMGRSTAARASAGAHRPLAALAVALAVALLAGASFAQQSGTTWEYAALIVEATGQATFISPDRNLDGLTMGAVTTDIREIYGARVQRTMNGLVDLLNAIGSGGWELVRDDGEQYLFKRPSR